MYRVWHMLLKSVGVNSCGWSSCCFIVKLRCWHLSKIAAVIDCIISYVYHGYRFPMRIQYMYYIRAEQVYITKYRSPYLGRQSLRYTLRKEYLVRNISDSVTTTDWRIPVSIDVFISLMSLVGLQFSHFPFHWDLSRLNVPCSVPCSYFIIWPWLLTE